MVLGLQPTFSPWIWICESLWDSVKIYWITVSIAPLNFSSGAILTEIKRIFSEPQRLTDSDLEQLFLRFAQRKQIWVLGSRKKMLLLRQQN